MHRQWTHRSPKNHRPKQMIWTDGDKHGAGPGSAQRGVEIARLLFVVDKIPKHERDRVGRDLLDYCHRDALAMVRLVETLEGLARELLHGAADSG